ncbi:uncharacterized protein HD556DRAFT_1439869 [Suillus plorans]|uniref:Uncharacterized protein n=1 Tax=Suillus plorans TaxID=116603 RepID=A0A9P7DNX0_9AGAM|nr:uncharacterized protein HD556DRAFT_1439869 [Suillus plorans]KAG1799489.1 hypothetical protein HD556DRAFT_1439869 [Suillus plorans]
MEKGNLEETRAQDLHRTDTLVTHLTTNPSDARTLFYEGKKTASSSTEECPSGRDKGDIHRILLKLIFEKDSEYSALYAEDLKKFDVSVGNRCTAKLFRDHHDKFNKTSTGVTLLDEHAAANLHKQVLLEFPWYDQLHPFLFSNPTISAKIFTSQPGVDHAADYYSLVRPCGGAGPSTNPPGPQLPQLPQLHPQNPQPPPPDPQLPLWSPPDTSAQRTPPSIQPGPTGAQHTPPSTLHPPPPHFSGTGGSPIDDPDGDLDDDPHADNNGPFFAPLGNALGWSLTPPVVVSLALIVPPSRWDRSGHTQLLLLPLPWKEKHLPSPAEAPDADIPQLQGIWLCLPWWPGATDIAQPFHSLVHGVFVLHIDRLLCFTNGIPDIAVCEATELGQLEEETDISERRESRNEHYAIKMNYQAQKKDLQWRRENLSHKVLISATTHQREQKAKDKEILHLQAAAALQEREAETWRLKIQYEMMIRAAGAGPSSSSPSV